MILFHEKDESEMKFMEAQRTFAASVKNAVLAEAQWECAFLMGLCGNVRDWCRF